MIYRLTLLLLFFGQHLFPQDSLVLYKKNNPAKEFKIPFQQYQVRVICDGNKRFSALISGYKDSVFVFRPVDRSKAIRKKATALYEQAMDSASVLQYTAEQYDSLMQAIAVKEKELFYPSEVRVPLSEVKKIKISIRDRPEKKRLVRNLNIAGYSALFATLLLTPVAVYVAPLSVVPFVAIPSFGFAIAFVVYDLVVETKRINLDKKWQVKAVL